MKQIKNPRHIVVKDFKYKGRRCVVILINMENEKISYLKPYHCGYVELKKKEIKKDYNDYKIEADEITYQGDLTFVDGLDCSDGKTYVGFDSAHAWNIDNPKSQTARYVEKTCKKIVNELNTKSKRLEK